MHMTRRQLGVSGLAAAVPGTALAGRRPSDVPLGACDCHVHVIGPQDRYPMHAGRVYTAPEASVAELLALRRRSGITRSVLVQPSFYGVDNRCMLDALEELGGSARGVAVVGHDVSQAELLDLKARRVCGVRLNLETVSNRDPAAASVQLADLGARLAPLGWHIQLFAALEVLAAMEPAIAASPVPVVIDHFGFSLACKTTDQPGFADLVRMVRDRRAYVKLSAPHRISTMEPVYADVAPIARALIEAAPDRLLWGSDWPHTQRLPQKDPAEIQPFRAVDDVHNLRLLLGWAGPTAFAQILVQNPARLYGFPS